MSTLYHTINHANDRRHRYAIYSTFVTHGVLARETMVRRAGFLRSP